MVNPAKAGDTKPWVYSHASGYDCQAAEDTALSSKNHNLIAAPAAWLPGRRRHRSLIIASRFHHPSGGLVTQAVFVSNIIR